MPGDTVILTRRGVPRGKKNMVGTGAATYDIVSLVCLYVCTILDLEAPMHDTYREVSSRLS